MTGDVTYTAVEPTNGGEVFAFEIQRGSSQFKVQISREAIEDYVAKRGLNTPRTPDELLHYAETYQPEFVQMATAKQVRVESVLITAEDVAD